MPTLRRLAALLALAPGLAAAQPDDSSQLPSLTPAVFESRGTVTVTLPEITRQPLSGFGPLPRRYVVPADRQAIVRPYAPDLDALPALALAPPTVPAFTDLAVHTLRAEGGAGSELGRYGRLDLSGAGAAGEFFVDADYDGLQDGAVNPGSGLDATVQFDRVEVRAGGRSFAPGRVHLEGHGLLDAYPVAGALDRRERLAYGAEAGLEGFGTVPYTITVGFEQGRLSTPGAAADTEGRVDAAGQIAAFGESVRIDGAAGVSGAGALGTDTRYGAAGLAVAFERAGGVELRIGARGLAYEASGEAGNAQYVAPIVDVSVPLGSVRAFVRNRPHVASRSLTDVTAANPFVLSDPLVVPDVVVVDAQAGAAVDRGPLRARAYALAFAAPSYLTFEQAGAGAFDTISLDVEAVGVGGDVALVTPTGVSATAGVELRRARAETGDAVPFFAPLRGWAGLQVPFADGRGRLGLAATAEGARPTAVLGDTDASGWGRLDVDASYVVSGPFAIVARASGLIGEDGRWPGAPQPPFTVLAGLRFAR